MSLERFLKAQRNEYSGYQTALNEMISGKKQSHWMWYIFPQIQGLGYSEMSKYYAIQSVEEALEYAEHPVLGKRLVVITEALLEIKENHAGIVMGFPDDAKLRSSMTLFYLATRKQIFKDVIDKFFGGEMDGRTIEIIEKMHLSDVNKERI